MPQGKDPEIRVQELENPDVTYEPTQADLRVVLGFLVALGLACAMVLLVLWGMFAYFRRQTAQWAPAPGVYSTAPKVPNPVLQPDPVADYGQFHLSEQQTLNSYGWVDQKAGVTHIPIDRAMNLLVERGLPWKTPGTTPSATPSTTPARSTAPSPAGAPAPVQSPGQRQQ